MPQGNPFTSVGSVRIHTVRLPCYLVEWYRPEFDTDQVGDTVVRLDEGVATMCGEGVEVQLLMTLAMPSDETIFGVFAAHREEDVYEVCRRAGVPVERLATALDARIAGRPWTR